MSTYTATRPQRYITNNRIMDYSERRNMPRQPQPRRNVNARVNARPKKKNKLMSSILFLFVELAILIAIGSQVFVILTKKSNVELLLNWKFHLG